MGRKKQFVDQTTISLTQEQLDFLNGLIEGNYAETISHGIRICINTCLRNARFLKNLKLNGIFNKGKECVKGGLN